MSDQGREFVNRVNEELFTLCGTGHRISLAYHPQSNGLDERLNQTLTRAFVKFVNDNRDDWDVHMKSILFAYRTSKNDSTKFTPFELMSGYAPVLPIEMEIRSKPSSTNSLSDKDGDVHSDFNKKIRVMMNIRDQLKAQAMQNIDKAQEWQKKLYNAKHQPLRFKEGDTVLLRNLRNEARKGGKLERAWSSSYTISKVLPNGLYRLLNEDGTELKTSFNSSRLKVYHHPVQSHLNTNTSAERLFKSGADKEDKDTSTDPTKCVKVNLLEKDRNTILSNGCLDKTTLSMNHKKF